jgi:hypothetical protein
MATNGVRAVKCSPETGQPSQQSPCRPEQIGDDESVALKNRVENGMGADDSRADGDERIGPYKPFVRQPGNSGKQSSQAWGMDWMNLEYQNQN